jgi:hypothetical protein
MKAVPDALPNADPFVGSALPATKAAATVDIGCRVARGPAARGGGKQFRVLYAALAVPSTTRRHPVEAGTEDVTQLFAAVAEHKLGRVPKLVTHHAGIVAAIVLEQVVIFDNHRRVDVRYLLPVLDSIRRYHGTCAHMVSGRWLDPYAPR